MTHRWLAQYPAGVPADIDAGGCPTLAALLADAFARHAARPACRFLGRDIPFERIDHLSRSLAAWLQARGLERGERVAVMMSHVPQYLVAVAAIVRAGLVLVNVDPLQTPRELEHQLKDSGAQGIVIQENFAATLQQVLGRTPMRTIVLAAAGDMLGLLKGAVVNHWARHVRRVVPPFEIPGATRFNDAVAQGRTLPWTDPQTEPDDIAMLQYTGGATGASKAAVLLHRNVVAAVLQCDAWFGPAFKRLPRGEQPVTVAAPPLHHAFGLHLGLLLSLRVGACALLVPNPRDIEALLRTLASETVHSLPASPALFGAMLNHTLAGRVDWRARPLCVSGGRALQPATAREWLQRTGCAILQSYGLAEAGPIASCHPVGAPGAQAADGIGVPLPGTQMRVVDDDGVELPPGQPGEIVVRGPQVMAGYWQRPDETARAMTDDGFLRTGDMGVMDGEGCFRLVDRRDDMIRVGDISIAPREIEDAVAALPGILEVAAVGMPNGAGDTIKVVVVRKDPALTESEVLAHARAHLRGLARPASVEFRNALPRTASGHILRRELRR